MRSEILADEAAKNYRVWKGLEKDGVYRVNKGADRKEMLPPASFHIPVLF